MKKISSTITILVIVMIAVLVIWKISMPNLSSKNKENTTEKVSKKVEKEPKKIKKKETSKAKSSTTETSSSVESESSSESFNESTSSASSYQPNVRFPELQAYAGKTYYAIHRDSAEYPQMFPTSFTITSDTETIIIGGRQEKIDSVRTGNFGSVMLGGGPVFVFAFTPLGNTDTVEVINQGQRLTYSTTMSE
ncbi:hypothetical protein B6U55_07270 [Ligilactobacillus salivarius]|uniref:hypothetical protein n=1 Tax=Ligilactobacillus salivarius TaxID=1624 RepID=UPI0009DA7789|nr:hypothetical protein [Ligilactobacillus salivarius]OQQ91850.1 hypothetical protein B6U55_07270 [Ligilactobacillus salivarius]